MKKFFIMSFMIVTLAAPAFAVSDLDVMTAWGPAGSMGCSFGNSQQRVMAVMRTDSRFSQTESGNSDMLTYEGQPGEGYSLVFSFKDNKLFAVTHVWAIEDPNTLLPVMYKMAQLYSQFEPFKSTAPAIRLDTITWKFSRSAVMFSTHDSNVCITFGQLR